MRPEKEIPQYRAPSPKEMSAGRHTAYWFFFNHIYYVANTGSFLPQLPNVLCDI